MANGIMVRKGRNGDLTFYIRYQAAGKDIRERVGRKSLGFTREMAKDALKARLGEIAQGRFNIEKTRKSVPFSTLIVEYRKYGESNKRAWKQEKHITEMFARRFGDKPLSQLTHLDVEQWKNERATQVQRNTINRELTVIKHICKKAIDWRMAGTNPATPVKRFFVNDQRTRFLSEEQVPQLLSECLKQPAHRWLCPLVTLAIHTGMRQGEILNLRWDNIDLNSGLITIKQGKTQRMKSISINRAAREALQWFAANRHGEYLLTSQLGKRIGKVTIYEAFREATRGASISDFRFNDLRHTFASHLAMSGTDLLTLKDLLGHTNIQMTTRYAHLYNEHKEKAVTRLDERLGSFKPDVGTDERPTVSPELKEAVLAVQPLDLAQSRHNLNQAKRAGERNVNDIEGKNVARDGIEPPTRGFSVL
jgi:integrase